MYILRLKNRRDSWMSGKQGGLCHIFYANDRMYYSNATIHGLDPSRWLRPVKMTLMREYIPSLC